MQRMSAVALNGTAAATAQMKKKLSSSGKVLPTFQTFCLDGVQIAQTVVHFAHFQNQARKRCVLGWGWGCFVYVDAIPVFIKIWPKILTIICTSPADFENAQGL